MTKTILVPVEPSEEMCSAGYTAARPIYEDDRCEPNPGDYKAIWSAMLSAAPKPTIPEDDREEVAQKLYGDFLDNAHPDDAEYWRIKADAAISTLISLGWKK